MEGVLVKKNRFGCEQNRDFKLYRNGEIKYFNGSKPKGTMFL